MILTEVTSALFIKKRYILVNYIGIVVSSDVSRNPSAHYAEY